MLILTSDNPQLSFLLSKNPAEGIVLQPLKEGVLAGWYPDRSDPRTFCVEFFDAPNASSFGQKNDSSGDYIDYTRYCTPELLYHFIKCMAKHIISKEQMKDDNPCNMSIRWIPVLADFTRIKKQFHSMGWKFTDLPLGYGLTDLTISVSNTTFKQFISGLYLFSHTLVNSHAADGSISLVAKVIQNVDLPYFVRKNLLLKLCGDEKTFHQWKTYFETPTMTLRFGNNAQQRSQFVMSQIKLDADVSMVIDLGCGDHPFLCKKRKPEIMYVGIDKDSSIIQSLQPLESDPELNNRFFQETEKAVEYVTDLQLGTELKLYVISTEVIEHMPEDDALKHLRMILQLNPHKIILTTPNKTFNPYYFIESDETRHEDHVNELTWEEFQVFVGKIAPLEYDVDFVKLGDNIGEVYNMSGCILTRKKL